MVKVCNELKQLDVNWLIGPVPDLIIKMRLNIMNWK